MLPSQLIDILYENQDDTYRQMQIRLLPNLSPDSIIGVRTPVLRSIARQLEDASAFRENLPHRFFEENQIHSFLLEREKNFDVAVSEIERFLPFLITGQHVINSGQDAFKRIARSCCHIFGNGLLPMSHIRFVLVWVC